MVAAYMVNVRILCILFCPIFTTTELLIFFLYKNKRSLIKPIYWKQILVFLLVSISIIYATWPYLWHHPLKHFSLAWDSMSKYNWGGNYLFQGKMITAKNTPWNYALVWMILTVPIIQIILLPIGITSFITNAISTIKKKNQWSE